MSDEMFFSYFKAKHLFYFVLSRAGRVLVGYLETLLHCELLHGVVWRGHGLWWGWVRDLLFRGVWRLMLWGSLDVEE